MSRLFLANYDGLNPGWAMMCLAHGYIDSAIILARRLHRTENDESQFTVDHALPCLLLIHQAGENFLKGASRLLMKPIRKGHDLEQILKQYSTIANAPPFDSRPIQDLFELERNAKVQGVHSQGYRYLLDQNDKYIWQGLSVPSYRLLLIANEMKRQMVEVQNSLAGPTPVSVWWRESKR